MSGMVGLGHAIRAGAAINEADPKSHWRTPLHIVLRVREMFAGEIELDPCTETSNPCGAKRFYAPPQDGATLSWDARSIYVNPPYGARLRGNARATSSGAIRADDRRGMPARRVLVRRRLR